MTLEKIENMKSHLFSLLFFSFIHMDNYTKFSLRMIHMMVLFPTIPSIVS